MRTFVFESEQSFSTTAAELFPFFADVGNLEKITPPWLGFSIMPPHPTNISKGTIINYRLRWRGVPLRWRTEISTWRPPFCFVDEQLKGPYRLWRHEHLFVEKSGVTTMTDKVQYAVPGGRLAQWLVVGRDVERIFSFRKNILESLLPF